MVLLWSGRQGGMEHALRTFTEPTSDSESTFQVWCPLAQLVLAEYALSASSKQSSCYRTRGSSALEWCELGGVPKPNLCGQRKSAAGPGCEHGGHCTFAGQAWP